MQTLNHSHRQNSQKAQTMNTSREKQPETLLWTYEH